MVRFSPVQSAAQFRSVLSGGIPPADLEFLHSRGVRLHHAEVTKTTTHREKRTSAAREPPEAERGEGAPRATAKGGPGDEVPRTYMSRCSAGLLEAPKLVYNVAGRIDTQNRGR
jgi:hypothetical protein